MQEKKRKYKLYKSHLMNVGITKSAKTIMGSILDLKTSTLSQHFNSDGTISHIFGPKNLRELDP